jgi:starch-binding outer membrane protein, SusD/RagB family
MKYKLKYLTRVIGLAVVALLSSCSLQYDPINTPVSVTYWKTEADANAAVLGSYYKLREVLDFGNGLSFFTYGDLPTQIFSDAAWNLHPLTGDYSWDGYGDNTNWTKFYKVILSANLSIKNISAMPLTAFGGSEVKRKSYVGEALFVRAYTYFYMTRIWGTVPMLLEPVEDASQAVKDFPMTKEDQLLDQCIADLKKADSCLTWQATAGKKAVRANRASVNALLAHVYMWRTRANKTTIDRNDFELALKCIDAIEANSGAQLESSDNLLSIWKGESIESLFEFPFKIADKEGFQMDPGGIADRFMGYPYNTNRKDNGPIFKFSSEFLNLFSELDKDVRVAKLFENFGDQSNCFTTKYNVIQYTNADRTAWETGGTVVIFRLADMYLLKAEALIKKTTPDLGLARTYLDKIRIRAGLDPYQGVDEALYEAVSDERARELFLEGHRLYDWVRTGFYAKKSRQGVYTQERYMQEGYLLPVNYDLIVNNKYVHQTPYWQDKMNNN